MHWQWLPVWLLYGWCHVKLPPSRRKFCVHRSAMHQFTVYDKAEEACTIFCQLIQKLQISDKLSKQQNPTKMYSFIFFCIPDQSSKCTRQNYNKKKMQKTQNKNKTKDVWRRGGVRSGSGRGQSIYWDLFQLCYRLPTLLQTPSYQTLQWRYFVSMYKHTQKLTKHFRILQNIIDSHTWHHEVYCITQDTVENSSTTYGLLYTRTC